MADTVTTPNPDFKRRLRDAYQRAGGQEAVESRTGIAQTTLSYWVGAAKKLPPPDRLATLATACGVTVEWLLTGASSRPRLVDQRLLALVIEEVERHLARPRPGARRRVMIPADKAALIVQVYAQAAARLEDRTPRSNSDLQTLVANLLLQQ